MEIPLEGAPAVTRVIDGTRRSWARDVTEDIARAVLNKASTERRSIAIAAQFLARVLGVEAPTGQRLRPAYAPDHARSLPERSECLAI